MSRIGDTSVRKDYYLQSHLHLLQALFLCLILPQSCTFGGDVFYTDASPSEILTRIDFRGIGKGDSIDVYCFKNDRTALLESRVRIAGSDGSANIITTGGEKIVCAVSGGPEISQLTTLQDFLEMRAKLQEDDSSHPILSGMASMRAGGEVSLRLSALLSRVMISRIDAAFPIMDACWYLTNVSASCPYIYEDSYEINDIMHYGRYCPSDSEQCSFDMKVQLGDIAGEGTVSDKWLYCYPNTSAFESPWTPFTSITLEGSVNDTTYYWTMPVNHEPYGLCSSTPGIERNAEYIYQLHIGKRGSLDPDKPIWIGATSMSVHPGQLLTGTVGEMLHIWVDTNPDWAEIVFDIEGLEFDRDRGIYDWELDADGRGVVLDLKKGGTGLFTIESGPPVNQSFLVMVVCDP